MLRAILPLAADDVVASLSFEPGVAPSTFVVVADKLWDDAVHALRCAPPGARPAILPSRRPRGVAWHKARSKWEVRAPMDGGFGVASVVSVADVCAVLEEGALTWRPMDVHRPRLPTWGQGRFCLP